MRANQPSLQSVLRIFLLVVMAASPALGKFGQERNGPIICADMEGRRNPAGGPECPWYADSVVIGYGEPVLLRIPFVQDPDIFYDPYTVYDGIWCVWKIYDPLGQEYSFPGRYADAHPQVPGAGISYQAFFPQVPGTYTAVCTLSDGRPPGDPARDDPVVKQMTMDVQCWYRINQIFSTDGTNTDGGSPKAGLVGVDVEWTAGYPPELMASHTCDYLYAPQIAWEGSWRTLSEERPPDFPHRGKYYFDSTIFFVSDFYHNSDDGSNWTVTAGFGLSLAYPDTQPFELHNLSVEDTGAEYLKYDPETGSGNTITYKLNDAYEVCPAAQDTTVYLTIRSSDGMFVRWEPFTQTAGRDRQYTYVWDGKDWEGNQAPKGIYTYSITAYQLAQIPDPAIPGNYIVHQEWDADKSLWSLSTNAEIIACDEGTGSSTVRVSFVADSGGMPVGANWKIDHAKLEVFDPDLIQIAGAQVGESPVDQTVYFPDLNITFDKGGTYVFLVSAWDRLYRDKLPMNRTHKIKPLLQQNSRIYRQTRHILIDPGHGAGCGANTGTHGCWYHSVPPGETPNTNRYSWDEKDYALELGLQLRSSLTTWYGSRCSADPIDVRMSRTNDTGMTLAQRVRWANRIREQYGEDEKFRFISLHANGIGNNYLTVDDFVAWWKAIDQDMANDILTGLQDEPIVPMSYGVEQHDYQVLSCDMPAVLVETVTLTNPDEEDWVRWQTNDANIHRLADRLREGILIGF